MFWSPNVPTSNSNVQVAIRRNSPTAVFIWSHCWNCLSQSKIPEAVHKCMWKYEEHKLAGKRNRNNRLVAENRTNREYVFFHLSSGIFSSLLFSNLHLLCFFHSLISFLAIDLWIIVIYSRCSSNHISINFCDKFWRI